MNPNIIFIDVPARQPLARVVFFLFQNSLQLVKKNMRDFMITSFLGQSGAQNCMNNGTQGQCQAAEFQII